MSDLEGGGRRASDAEGSALRPRRSRRIARLGWVLTAIALALVVAMIVVGTVRILVG